MERGIKANGKAAPSQATLQGTRSSQPINMKTKPRLVTIPVLITIRVLKRRPRRTFSSSVTFTATNRSHLSVSHVCGFLLCSFILIPHAARPE